ncbi:MAG: M23 family metallopeptidase [Candidatus Hydrogenedentota bacterium]|nr:MAG: M23 family metallopeptidase [Candidatus Hydrogenedentota bacterium]
MLSAFLVMKTRMHTLRSHFAKEKARQKKKYITFLLLSHDGTKILSFNYTKNFSYFVLILFSCMLLAFVFSLTKASFRPKEHKIAKRWERESLKIWYSKKLLKKIYKRLHSQSQQAKRFLQSLNLPSEHDNEISSIKKAIHFIWVVESNYLALPLGLPTEGFITSNYGKRASPFGVGEDFHLGYDIANGTGMPIYATADGKVIYAGGERSSGYGLHVKILHKNGIITLYGHCSELKVEEDDFVKRGQEIALTGSTGEVTGAHLHYEIRLQYNDPISPYELAINPGPFLREKPILLKEVF